MQDSILLVIKEKTLRRLYHGLLFQQGIEVIPLAKIEDALVMQTLNIVPMVVIYPEDMNEADIRAFLQLQRSFPRFKDTSVVLLTSQGDIYDSIITPNSHIVNVGKLNPVETINKIIYYYDDIIDPTTNTN